MEGKGREGKGACPKESRKRSREMTIVNRKKDAEKCVVVNADLVVKDENPYFLVKETPHTARWVKSKYGQMPGLMMLACYLDGTFDKPNMVVA